MLHRTLLLVAVSLFLSSQGAGLLGQDLVSAARTGNIDVIVKAFEKDKKVLNAAQPGGTRLILAAIQNGPIETVEKLLELGANVDVSNNQGHTALHLAVMRRDAKILDRVLATQPKLDAKDRNKYTPLIMAMYYQNIPAAKKLIKLGCDVNMRDAQGSTPLHIAMSNRSAELVKVLIDKGCDVHITNNYGQTPYMNACQTGNLEIVKKYFDADKANLVTKQQQTILTMACYSQNADLVEFLCERTDLENKADQNGFTPVAIAASMNATPIVKVLLKHEADPNVVPKQNYMLPAIFSAANNGNAEMIKALTDAGAKVSLKLNQDDTPLHAICRIPSYQYGSADPNLKKRVAKGVSALLNAGADPNAKNKAGQTPIEVAVYADFHEAIDLLIRQTKDVEFDLGGQSFLHWACDNNMPNSVRFLLERDKSKTNSKDKSGLTPLCIAAANSNLPIVEMLIAAGAKPNLASDDGMFPIHYGVSSKSGDILSQLIDAGADVSASDSSGRTALHVAAWNGNVEAIKLLAKKSVNITPTNQSGATPLHMAAWQGQLDAAKLLLDYTADVNRADSDGWSPLHKAAHKGNLPMVRLLLSRGADKSAKDSIGLTAADKVGGDKKDEIAKLLQ